MDDIVALFKFIEIVPNSSDGKCYDRVYIFYGPMAFSEFQTEEEKAKDERR